MSALQPRSTLIDSRLPYTTPLRSPAGGCLLHRRPLPQLPPLRAGGVGAMSAFELRALRADASQNGSYFIDMRDREGLDEVARELGHAVAAIDLAGCRDKDDVLDQIGRAHV